MIKKLLLWIVVMLFLPSVLCADTGTSVSKDGVTFNFADTETYGTFINGDYWVVGPVTITSITPNYSDVDVSINRLSPYYLPAEGEGDPTNWELSFTVTVSSLVVQTESRSVTHVYYYKKKGSGALSSAYEMTAGGGGTYTSTIAFDSTPNTTWTIYFEVCDDRSPSYCSRTTTAFTMRVAYDDSDEYPRGTNTPGNTTHSLNRSGWEVNPLVGYYNQGFSSGCKNGVFDATRVLPLEYDAVAGDSIVKTISPGDGAQVCVETAVVLTVLAEAPASPSTTFRPPYFGTNKTQYTTANLQAQYWPSYADPNNGNTPSLSTIEGRFNSLRMEINENGVGRDLKPSLATGVGDGYGPNVAQNVYDSALRLMLSDGYGTTTFYKFMNYALDKALSTDQGYNTYTMDGHNPGHYVMAIIGAIMFNLTTTKTALTNHTCSGYDCFHEFRYMHWNHDSSYSLFGRPDYSETQYWNYYVSTDGERSIADPYDYIDGGNATGGGYQPILSQGWKTSYLLGILMPEIQNVWNAADWAMISSYAERWYSIGFLYTSALTGDPCGGRDSGTYGVDYGPDPGSAGCIENTPTRSSYTEAADGGQYKSDFVSDMWTDYKDNPWTDGSPSAPTALGVSLLGVTIQ